ncbi:MAG: hypothetical protein KAJ03_05145 [Gammaproteobacteria bacterium]|nr:hypothetical protein [Gammaproteobacteria bacterium]
MSERVSVKTILVYGYLTLSIIMLWAGAEYGYTVLASGGELDLMRFGVYVVPFQLIWVYVLFAKHQNDCVEEDGICRVTEDVKKRL